MPAYSIDGVVPVVDPASFVHPTAILIGDIVIGPNCYIGPGASLRGDFGRVMMGPGSNLQDNCVIHGFPNSDTILEENAHIGHGAVLHGCIVRRAAMVGMNAVVMDGAEIGEQALVAAMSFVKAAFIVPPRMLVAGIPARVMRELTAQELDWKMQGTREYQYLTRRCFESFAEVTPLTAPEPNRPRVKPSPVEPLYKLKRQR